MSEAVDVYSGRYLQKLLKKISIAFGKWEEGGIKADMEYKIEDFFAALDERHTTEVRKKLWEARVGIAGIGGLGSNTATALARAGVGHIHIVDDDEVDLPNINRQAYFYRHVGRKKTDALTEIIHDINPYIEVTADCVRVTEETVAEIFSGDKIICEAFDKAENKAAFVNGVLASLPDAVLVSGIGMAGYSDTNLIRTRKITNHFYVCGDEKNGLESGQKLMAPRVTACSAHQANMVIRLILGEE